MNFSEALEAMRIGKKVARKDWDGSFCDLTRGVISMIYKGRIRYPEIGYCDEDIFSSDDILADDWEIFNDA